MEIRRLSVAKGEMFSDQDMKNGGQGVCGRADYCG